MAPHGCYCMVGNFCGFQIFVDFIGFLSMKITEFSVIRVGSYTTKI